MRFFFDKINCYLVYSIFFLPLLVVPSIMFPWSLGKTIIFQIIIEILFFTSFLYITAKNSYKSLNILDKSILFFTALLVLSSWWGVNFLNSWWGNQSRADGVFTFVHFIIFYFLVKNFFLHYNDRKIFVVNSIVAFLVGLSAIFQAWLPLSWQSNIGERAAGIIGNAAFLAAYLVLSVGINFITAAKIQSKLRYLFLGNGIFLLTVIFLTGTRGAFVGLVAGCCVSVIFLLQRGSKELKRKIIWSFGGLVILVASIGGVLTFTHKNSIQKFFTNWRQGSVDTRLMAWEIAWQGIKARPWGWGMGNYQIVFDKNYNPKFLNYTFAETVWDKPHNIVLEIAVGAGVIGAISYLIIFIIAGWAVVNNLTSAQGNKYKEVFQSLLLGIFTAYLVQNLFLFDTANTLILWYMLLAYVSAYFFNNNFSTLLESKKTFSGVRLGLVVLMAVGIALVEYQANYLLLKQSYYDKKSVDSLRPKYWQDPTMKALGIHSPYPAETGIFLAQKLIELHNKNLISNGGDIKNSAINVAEFLHGYAEKYPDNLNFSLWEAQTYLVLAQHVDTAYYVQAEDAINQAELIAPRKQEVWFVAGRIYLLQKKWDSAILVHKKAVDIDESVAISHWFLGLTYAAAQKNDLALVEIEKSIDLGKILNVDEKLLLVDLYLGQKQYDKIILIYENLKKQNPENINWCIRLAATYVAKGDKKSALENVNKALKLDPSIEKEAKDFIKKNSLE